MSCSAGLLGWSPVGHRRKQPGSRQHPASQQQQRLPARCCTAARPGRPPGSCGPGRGMGWQRSSLYSCAAAPLQRAGPHPTPPPPACYPTTPPLAPDHIFCHAPAAVADHFCLALRQPEKVLGQQAAVHASENHQASGDPQTHVRLVLPALQQRVGDVEGIELAEVIGQRAVGKGDERAAADSAAATAALRRCGCPGWLVPSCGLPLPPLHGSPALSCWYALLAARTSSKAAEAGMAAEALTIAQGNPGVASLLASRVC